MYEANKFVFKRNAIVHEALAFDVAPYLYPLSYLQLPDHGLPTVRSWTVNGYVGIGERPIHACAPMEGHGGEPYIKAF